MSPLTPTPLDGGLFGATAASPANGATHAALGYVPPRMVELKAAVGEALCAEAACGPRQMRPDSYI